MKKILLLLFSLLLGFASSALASGAPKTVVSIQPVHSLVAAVMEGVDTPYLLIEGAQSPHSSAFKPSQAAALESAQVIFWIGPELEAFLETPIENLPNGAKIIALSQAPGLIKLKPRTGEDFETHEHGGPEPEAEHEEHTGYGHEHNNDHAGGKEEHEEHAGHGHGHEHNHDHASGEDVHFWLDPQNARAMADAIAAALSEVDPSNHALYAANAETLKTKLTALEKEIAAKLAPVQDKPYAVFHDAYQYFENRFGLKALGAVTLNVNITPSARQMRAIETQLQESGALCVFSEPQFSPRAIAALRESTGVRTGVLDPLGAALEQGPTLYFQLLENMADALYGCLSSS